MFGAVPVPLALRTADAASVVLPVIVIVMAPLWVPMLMASKAPFSVVNVPVAVPEVAERDTCEYPARLPVSRIIKKKLLIRLYTDFIAIGVNGEKNVGRN